MRWGYRKLQLDKSQLRPLKDGKPAISDWQAVHSSAAISFSGYRAETSLAHFVFLLQWEPDS
jgi:hypothetical protein